jgi:septal ring factor EnvC (AmiA/AmiB activator)
VPSAKTQLLLLVVGGIISIVTLIVKHRQAMEAQKAKLEAEKELADERTAAQERAARHAAEAEERERAAAEREKDREQRERLIETLQKNSGEMMTFLKSQLQASQEAGAKRYDIIEKNTAANADLARGVAEQARELRVLVDRVARIEGGSGCRAGLQNGRTT